MEEKIVLEPLLPNPEVSSDIAMSTSKPSPAHFMRSQAGFMTAGGHMVGMGLFVLTMGAAAVLCQGIFLSSGYTLVTLGILFILLFILTHAIADILDGLGGFGIAIVVVFILGVGLNIGAGQFIRYLHGQRAANAAALGVEIQSALEKIVEKPGAQGYPTAISDWKVLVELCASNGVTLPTKGGSLVSYEIPEGMDGSAPDRYLLTLRVNSLPEQHESGMIRIGPPEVGNASEPGTTFQNDGESKGKVSWVLVFLSSGGVLAFAIIVGFVRLRPMAVVVWEIERGRRIAKLKGDEMVERLRFSRHGDVLAAELRRRIDRKVVLWCLETGERLPLHHLVAVKEGLTVKVRNAPLSIPALSPDRQISAHGRAGATILLLNAETKEKLQQWRGHENAVRALAFSNDGATLASGDAGGVIRLWDLHTNQKRLELLGQGKCKVCCVRFHPDGVRMASGARNGTVCIWNLETGTIEKVLKWKTGRIRNLAFSPDGDMLAAGFDPSKYF